jgi:hypothetical protein
VRRTNEPLSYSINTKYANEKRGSKNFLKERKEYIEDKEKIKTSRILLQEDIKR